MRISRSHLRAALVAALLPVLNAGAFAETLTFSSPREALKQGMSAYQGGYYEIAIPALEFAASKKEFMAEYYLARIYSDNSGAHTNHAKAYLLFQRIADEYADADPDDDPRAPYVGKSLTALAGYVRRGIKEIGVKPDIQQAILYLQNASTTFADEDAQFELAKLKLSGEGLEEDEAMGRHWLADLSERGHAGAQAFLADLLWRGKYMKADKATALALIAVAVENAPVYDRLWIEDIYQNIFCGSGEGIRTQATGIVAEWGNRFGRKPEAREASGLGLLATGPERTCRNGERVGSIKGLEDAAVAAPLKPVPATPLTPQGFMYGTTTPTLRDVGGEIRDPDNR
jgi:TPR repeat protein